MTDSCRRAKPLTAARILGAPGAIAQLGERLLCKQEVTGSIPVGSTRELPANGLVFGAVEALWEGFCRPPERGFVPSGAQ